MGIEDQPQEWTTKKAYENDDWTYHVVSGDVIVCTVHQLYAEAITRCHNAAMAAEREKRKLTPDPQ